MKSGNIIFALVILALLAAAFVFNVGGTVITQENALEHCPILNVKCDKLLDNYVEPNVQYVGDKVLVYCSGNNWGCYHFDNNTIYLREEDWQTLAHEKCHAYCGREHINKSIKDTFYTIPKIR